MERNTGNNETKRPNYTQEQKIFISGMKQLRELPEELTPQQALLKDKILETLWGCVLKYAMSEAYRMMERFAKSSDAYADVQQELAQIFYEKLPNYNPRLFAPTTYFKPYFRQAIRDYLHRNSQFLTPYEAKNVSNVRRAIQYYESMGVKWSEDMLSTRTGLSPKVVKSTLLRAYNSKRANIDDAMNLQAKILTPEEQFVQNEKTRILVESLQNCLTADELKLFMLRVNLEGQREMPFEKISEMTGIPVRDVKKVINRCLAKLQSSERLSNLYKSYNEKYCTELKFQENTADMMEEQLMQEFCFGQADTPDGTQSATN